MNMDDCIEILTEELSMEYFLRSTLPQILPDDYKLDVNCFIRTHEGKMHLQKSIATKMKAYSYLKYQVKVLIIHDQDSNDCKKLKDDLQKSCAPFGKVPFLIRIACRELENWYLGDFDAIAKAYSNISVVRHKNKAKYRNADRTHGAYEMQKLVKQFEKIDAAKRIPQYMKIDKNTSASFQHFVSGVRKLLNPL